MSLGEVLAHLGARDAEGTLRCVRGTDEAIFSVQRGAVVDARSNQRHEYLGQFLIQGGHIDETQLAEAFKTQQETQVPLGRILIMIGLVDEATLVQTLGEKILSTAAARLSWRTGDFHFSTEAIEIPEGETVRLEVNELLSRALSRETRSRQLAERFPSGATTFEVDLVAADSAGANPFNRRVFGLAMEGASLDDMILALHATRYAVYEAAAAGMDAGVLSLASDVEVAVELDESVELEVEVEADEGPIPGTLGDATSGSALHDHVARFLSDGNYSAAEGLALSLAESHPEDPYAQSLLRQAQAGLLVELRTELVRADFRPKQQSVPGPNIALSPEERYVLTQATGEVEVSVLLQVGSLDELVALKALSRLQQLGLVR